MMVGANDETPSGYYDDSQPANRADTSLIKRLYFCGDICFKPYFYCIRVYIFPSDWTSEKLSKLWIAFWDSRQSSNVVLFLKAWYWAIYSKILWNSPLFPFISSICLSWVRITESDFLFSLGFPISKIPDFMVFRFRFLCRINNDFLQNSDNFLHGLDSCIILCSL